jgi:hypothetical protein
MLQTLEWLRRFLTGSDAIVLQAVERTAMADGPPRTPDLSHRHDEAGDDMKHAVVATLSLLAACRADADSFRCGTRLVITGDPVSRLLRLCGPPALKIRSQETVGRGSRASGASVSKWLYERGRKRDVVVSVKNGLVVKIAVE